MSTALTDNFMLGTATVMIGPQADLFKLAPLTHSIGLVKNFAMTSEPSYTELTQGTKNTIVASVMTSNPVRASMEVYEYTSKTLSYGLGLDGSTMQAQTTATTLSTAVDYTAPTAVTTIEVASATGITAGKMLMIQNGTGDDVTIRKVASVASNVITLTEGITRDIPSGAAVKVVNAINVGSKDEQPFLSAMIVGTLANNQEVVILIPKLRIVRGFNMAFSTDNFGNLPFEFTVYDLTASDPNYSYFGTASSQILTVA